MNKMTKLSKLSEKLEKIKEEMKKEAKNIFMPEAKAIFDKYPELKKFGWKQYTPYFNDGDTCEFGTTVEYPLIVLGDISEDEIEDYVSDNGPEGIVGESKKSEKIEKEIIAFLSQIPEEIYLDMFGDHVEIEVSRDGIEVNEYDHD